MDRRRLRDIFKPINVLNRLHKVFASVSAIFATPSSAQPSAQPSRQAHPLTSTQISSNDETVIGEDLVKHDHWKERHPNRETSPLILAYLPGISSLQNTSRFLTLPLELRMAIYSYVFNSTVIHLCLSSGRLGMRSDDQDCLLGLSLACRQLYKETIAYIYANTQFHMATLPTLSLFRLSIPLIQLASIRKLTLDLGWDELLEWYTDTPILEVSLKFELNFIPCFSRLKELVLVVKDNLLWVVPEGMIAWLLRAMCERKDLRVRRVVVDKGWRRHWEAVRKNEGIRSRVVEIVEAVDESV